MPGALEICLLVCIDLYCSLFVTDVSRMSKTRVNLIPGQEDKHINGFGLSIFSYFSRRWYFTL